MQRCVRCFCVYLNKGGALSKLSAYFTVVLFAAGILNFINTMSARSLEEDGNPAVRYKGTGIRSIVERLWGN